MSLVNRRNFLRGTAAAVTGLIFTGCDRLARSSGLIRFSMVPKALINGYEKSLPEEDWRKSFPRARYRRSFAPTEAPIRTATRISKCSRMLLPIID